jgi:hypothetical protein
MSRCRSWVGARRVALLYVSSRPPLRTGLTAFTVSGSAPLVDLHGATMKHLCPFRRHPQDFTHVCFHFASIHEITLVDSLRVRGVLCSPPTLCTSYFQRLGAFAVSPHPGVRGFPTLRLLCPIRLFVRALACRWGLPSLLPTRLDIPYEVSRVRCRSLKRNG